MIVPPTTKFPPTVTIPEKHALPFSNMDTPIPVPAVLPISKAAVGTFVPTPTRPVLLSTKKVVIPTFKSLLKLDIPVKVEKPETVIQSSILIVPPAESRIKLSVEVSISLSPVTPI